MCNAGGIALILMKTDAAPSTLVEFSSCRCQKSVCPQTCFCSCNINGISCTEACTCMADDNNITNINPHKYLLNDADGGDDDNDDEGGDCSEM